MIHLIQRLYNESNEARIARGEQSRIAALSIQSDDARSVETLLENCISKLKPKR